MIPKAAAETPETGPKKWPDDAEYAGFTMRSLTFLIDSLALLLPFALLALVVNLLLGPPPVADLAAIQSIQDPALQSQEMMRFLLAPEFLGRFLLDNALALILTAVLFIGFWHYYSATPGKLVLGMKIVDAETGQPPTRRQGVIRFAGYVVSTAALMLGFFNIIWDGRKQGWHDKMAKTVVVYTRSLPQELAQATRHGQLARQGGGDGT